MASPRILLFLMILAFGAEIVNVTSDLLQCSPVKALFIFDKYEFGQSFIQLRRFIIKFVAGLPNETPVYVVPVDNKTKPFEFKKIAGDESWKNNIGKESSIHVNITYETIRHAIYSFLDKNRNEKMAEIIIWLVNNNTIIEQKVLKAMEYKNNQIVWYGKHSKGNVWTNLLSSKESVQELDDSEKIISYTVESVKRQACLDFLSSAKQNNKPSTKDISQSKKYKTSTDHVGKLGIQEKDNINIQHIYIMIVGTVLLLIVLFKIFKKKLITLYESVWGWLRRKLFNSGDNEYPEETQQKQTNPTDESSQEVAVSSMKKREDGSHPNYKYSRAKSSSSSLEDLGVDARDEQKD